MEALDQAKAGAGNALSEIRPEDKPEPAKTAVGTKLPIRTELPRVPMPVDAPARAATDLPAAGNINYTVELKEHGQLGLFFKRANTAPLPKKVFLNPTEYFTGIRETIRAELRHLERKKSTLGDQAVTRRINDHSESLAIGCCLMTYLKIRSIVLTELQTEYDANSLRRPRAPADIAIPTAFAFAIQQLGTVRVADLTDDRRYIPCLPTTGHQYGIPTNHSWNPNAYAQAVEYARNLGMRFNIVDLKVKNGSPWWLLRQFYEDEVFELRCIIPEVNYTDAMAVIHSLWLSSDTADPSNSFVDLSGFPAANDYGILLQNPHAGINVSSFEALSDVSSEIWANV